MENKREETQTTEREVRDLQTVLRRDKALLQDAEQRRVVGECSKLFLQQLKDLVYDVEDVLGLFEYEDLRYQVESSCLLHQDGRGETSSSTTLTTPSFHYEVSFCREMGARLDDIRRRRDDIFKNKSEFAGVGDLDGQTKETSSLPMSSQMYGREDDKNRLMGFLTAADDDTKSTSTPSVVSIIGIGGVGKTTLARHVYNDERIKEHFPLRMWVHVSPKFHLLTVTKKIVECVVVEDMLGETQNLNNLDSLQKYLLNSLKGRRFMLVLDDVWEDNYNSWLDLYLPLLSGERGSKILVTARSAGVANASRSRETIYLDDLSKDDSWLIFKMHAFLDGDSDDRYPRLESIGKEIVKKLSGNPLALSTIGGMLRFESEECKWRNILESQLWELKQDDRGILPALRVSYEYLPVQVKPCFAYCCIFPKGEPFDKLEFIQLWMAQGYLCPHRKMSMEDVGMEYLQDLINRSLIQLVDDRCVIHDLVHDLGRFVLQNEPCEIGLDEVQEIHSDICSKRHLIFHWSDDEKIEALCKFKNLHTVSFWFTGFPHIQLPLDLFSKLTYLRMLDLSYSNLFEVPNSIDCLKSLKYLDLRKTSIRTLPDSICTLYKLQTLRLVGCSELRTLPKNMSHLVNLHHLEAASELVSSICRIGNFIHLQNLDLFSVPKEAMNSIRDLRYMNSLYGKLCIQNLNNVETREEAFEAALLSKTHLKILELVWSLDRDANQIDSNNEELILEELQPPPQLKVLILDCYAGVCFPRWMYNGSISMFQCLLLRRCKSLGDFQRLKWLDSLTTLEITSCPQFEELPRLPPRVNRLILRDVAGLLALPDNLHELSLEQLILWDIPRLEKLPPLPLTLKELEIDGLPLQLLPDFPEVPELLAETKNRTEKNQSNHHEQAQLLVLKILNCQCLKTLQDGFLKHRLDHLQVLCIKGCSKLGDWPNEEGFLSALCSVKEEFSIERCPELKALPEGVQLHPSLKKLRLIGCPKVPNESFYSQLSKFLSDDIRVLNLYGEMRLVVDKALEHLQDIDVIRN